MPAAASAPDRCAAAERLGLRVCPLAAPSPAGQSRARVAPAEARAALAAAAAAGVRLMDAGARDGEAETVLGQALPALADVCAPFQVIVRTSAFAGDPATVEAGARASLRRLGLERAGALVVRGSGDLLRSEGMDLWTRLLALRDAGAFDKIGIVAAPGDDVVGLARRFKPDLIQVPASLMDPRPMFDGTLERLVALGIEVHLRRVFHQGVLFQSGAFAGGAGAAPRLSRLRRLIAEAGADPLQAALAFALARPEAAFVIVGVSSPPELRAVLAAAASGAPDLDLVALARAGVRDLPTAAAAA